MCIKPTKIFYDKMVKPFVDIPTSQKKWNDLFPDIEVKDWSSIYALPFRVSNSTKLRMTQFTIFTSNSSHKPFTKTYGNCR